MTSGANRSRLLTMLLGPASAGTAAELAAEVAGRAFGGGRCGGAGTRKAACTLGPAGLFARGGNGTGSAPAAGRLAAEAGRADLDVVSCVADDEDAAAVSVAGGAEPFAGGGRAGLAAALTSAAYNGAAAIRGFAGGTTAAGAGAAALAGLEAGGGGTGLACAGATAAAFGGL